MWAPVFMILIVASSALPVPPTIENATAAGAAVRAAYAKVKAEESKLAPPTSDRERLVRLQAEDQAGREVLSTIDLSHMTSAERRAAMNLMGEQITRHDQEDQAALRALMPRSGWFPISVYGTDGALAAWLIVQHATNDPALMRATVQKLDKMRRTGEAKPQAYAIMYDRVALMFDHKPQRFGTQLKCQAGLLRPEKVEDPDHLDQRRKNIGFPQTEAGYVASMEDGSCKRLP